MKRSKCVLRAAGLFMAAVLAVSANQSNPLEEGVSAFNRGELRNAVAAFEQAVQADPNSLLARRHLANAKLMVFLSSNKDQNGTALAEEARRSLRELIERDPADSTTLKNLVTLELRTHDTAQALTWCEKLVQAEPTSSDGWYLRGVIRWMEAYFPIQEARKQVGMQPQSAPPIADAAVREAVGRKVATAIDDGLAALDRALRMKPDSSEVMAYQNLLFRLKADLAGSQAGARDFLLQADRKMENALSAQGHGGSMPASAMRVSAAVPPGPALLPPPPPPPPPPSRN